MKNPHAVNPHAVNPDRFDWEPGQRLMRPAEALAVWAEPRREGTISYEFTLGVLEKILPQGWIVTGRRADGWAVRKVESKNPHAVALGRKGGSVRSEAKARAARENAKKPRPRLKPVAKINPA